MDLYKGFQWAELPSFWQTLQTAVFQTPQPTSFRLSVDRTTTFPEVRVHHYGNSG